MKLTSPESLRVVAKQLEEDAKDCWGIRRKMNLKSAILHLNAAADILDERKHISKETKVSDAKNS